MTALTLTNFLQPHRNFDPSLSEIMDRQQPVSDDLKIALDNMEKLNRRFGGYDLIRHFLRRWIASGESVSLLDLCTGSGDIPRYVADWWRAQKSIVTIHAIDAQPSTLSIAQARSVLYPEITKRRMCCALSRRNRSISSFVPWLQRYSSRKINQ